MTANTSTAPRAGNRKIAARRKPLSIAAVNTRTLSIGRRRELRRRLAEAPLALRVVLESGGQIFGCELGPERVAEIQFGVREIPQQEIADALLAPGADQQVRIRRPGQGKPVRDPRLVNLRRLQPA